VNPTKASLVQANDKTKVVEFQFNPSTIKVGHGAETKAINRAMGITEAETTNQPMFVLPGGEVLTNAGDTTISFNSVTLDGSLVVAKCKQLLKWSYAVKVPSVGSNKTDDSIIQELNFSWGAFDLGIPFPAASVLLTKVDIEYSRFTGQGEATRASAVLTLKVKVPDPPGQKSGAGGAPVIGGHRVTAGQNIQGVAQDRYGDPQRWRDVAAANGVDDPLRVRPGDVLMLPNPARAAR
jgi:nucleoid-associated protein YgaU